MFFSPLILIFCSALCTDKVIEPLFAEHYVWQSEEWTELQKCRQHLLTQVLIAFLILIITHLYKGLMALISSFVALLDHSGSICELCPFSDP